MRRTCLVIACCLTWHLSAWADDSRPSARLKYTVVDTSDSCPSKDELESAVAARLGYVPFANDDPRLVSVTIVREPKAFRARMEVSSANEPLALRELSSETLDCEELGRALAIAVSVAVDPMSLTRAAGTPPPTSTVAEGPAEEPTKDPAPPVQTEAHPKPAAAKEQQPGPAQSEDPASAWFLGAQVRGNLGLTPRPGVGASVTGGKRWRRLLLALEPSFDFPTRKSRADGAAVSGQAVLLSGEACGLITWLRLCGVTTGGLYLGRGIEVSEPSRAATPWGAAGPRVMAVFPSQKRLQFVVGGTALIGFTPTRLELDGDTVFTTAPVTALVQLGFEYSFLGSP